ncbi:Hypothetical predicted protein [Xyrichtys novacula]|uniref:Uncharacterized protein n=1 Tax=Xyrichtys novacula TaxID=13765 RepID=A0AAV1HDS8_XYRNO|nr:Hypothetical predicted protein [Xyrichtys novacula]
MEPYHSSPHHYTIQLTLLGKHITFRPGLPGQDCHSSDTSFISQAALLSREQMCFNFCLSEARNRITGTYTASSGYSTGCALYIAPPYGLICWQQQDRGRQMEELSDVAAGYSSPDSTAMSQISFNGMDREKCVRTDEATAMTSK